MALKQTVLTATLAFSALAGPALAQEGPGGWPSSVSWGVEREDWRCTDGCDTSERGGKTKVTLLNLSVRPMEGLSFGTYVGREFVDGSDNSDNTIAEVFVSRNLPNNIWIGGVIQNESADNRLDVGVKAGGSYKIAEAVDIHGYAFVKHRFRGKPDGGVGNYFEIEPGLGFKISDQVGGWLNLRYQGWDWEVLDDERELFLKPGISYNPVGNWNAALWAEINQFEKKAVRYTEDSSRSACRESTS